MYQIVNNVWSYFSESIKFFMASFMDKNMLSHQFVNYFDQIWILLKLLCGKI
jgi:hypothetical protein